MVGMTSHAIGLGKSLMKRNLPAKSGDCFTFGRAQTDLRNLMAIGAAICRCARKWRVAGKAIIGDLGMRRNHCSGCDHGLRPNHGQADQQAKANGDHDKGPAALHFQPQNKKMAMMCASARPAKASVIGTWTVRHCLTAL